MGLGAFRNGRHRPITPWVGSWAQRELDRRERRGPLPSGLPLKGELGGMCNRSACDTYPARFFNYWTRAHYCTVCAREINFHAPPRPNGTPCCQEIKQ